MKIDSPKRRWAIGNDYAKDSIRIDLAHSTLSFSVEYGAGHGVGRERKSAGITLVSVSKSIRLDDPDEWISDRKATGRVCVLESPIVGQRYCFGEVRSEDIQTHSP